MRRYSSLVAAALVLAMSAPTAASSAPPTEGPMNLEPLRIVTDWLGNATYGVNAKLATLPRDAGDSAPPSVQLIADETRSGPVARDRIPIPATPGPVLTLACIEESIWNTVLEDKYRDCEALPIEIRYADLDKVVTQTGTQNAYYTMRAVLRSLKDLMNDPGNAARQRNLVTLVNTSDLVRIRPTMKEIEDKIIVASMSVTFGFRDEAP